MLLKLIRLKKYDNANPSEFKLQCKKIEKKNKTKQKGRSLNWFHKAGLLRLDPNHSTMTKMAQ
jgi:hypothetical protein